MSNVDASMPSASNSARDWPIRWPTVLALKHPAALSSTPADSSQ